MDNAFLVALLQKMIGSSAGAIMAVIFMVPKTRRELASRLVTAFVAGIIFATGMRQFLGWPDDVDGVIAGACVAAFVSWWAMGAVVHFTRSGKRDGSKDGPA